MCWTCHLQLDNCSYGGFDQSPLPSDVICACLRLGHKYQINSIVFESIKRIQRHFPVTLAQMDASHLKATIEFHRPADYFDLANLLRDMECLPLLPMALFRCISGPDMFSTIVAGAARRDGSWSTLSRDNLIACVPAWRSMFQEVYDQSRRWHDMTDPSCIASNTCRKQIASFVDSPMEDMMELRTLFRSWRTEWESRMCPGCVELWKSRFKLSRHDCFENLPSHFGLPGWDTLTNAASVSTPSLNSYVTIANRARDH